MHPRTASHSLLARLSLGLALTAVLSIVLVTVPVVSGAGTANTPVALESSSVTTEHATPTPHGESPVIMGQDGLGATPAPGTTPGSPSPEPAAAETPAEETPTGETQAEETVSGTSSSPSATTLPGTTAPESSTPAPTAPASATAAGLAEQVVALVNSERTAAGCGPVTSDAALAAVARAHSEDMRDRDFFDHVNPEGLDPFDRARAAGLTARAENIAYGQPAPAAVMTSWMNSPGHRANILDCGLTRLGVGVAEGSGGPWWTQLFG